MEDLIGILVVLALGIVKLIGKNLNDAGKKPAKTYTTVDEAPLPRAKVYVPDGTTQKPEPIAQKPYKPKPVAPKVQSSTIEVVNRQTAPKKPILEEIERKGPKEKIDPKKLVLYSEIMKPKFNE